MSAVLVVIVAWALSVPAWVVYDLARRNRRNG